MKLESTASSGRGLMSHRSACGIVAIGLGLLAASTASAATLERIKESGHIRLGYVVDGAPFTRRDGSGNPEGYGVALCERIAEDVKAQLAMSDLKVDWVPIDANGRVDDVKAGTIDLSCTPASVTLTRRADASFSIPVFPGGVRAVVRADAPAALSQALSESPAARPVWRGAPAATLLGKTTFGTVAGSTTESWLAERLKTFNLEAKTQTVADYREGLKALKDRKIDVFFGDRTVVLGAMDPNARQDYVILDRMMTHEAVALPLARGDDDFRLAVDSALSRLFASTGFKDVYSKWVGSYDDSTRTFFQWVVLPK